MSLDFTQLLGRTPDQAPKPSALPVGDYPGIIKSWKTGEKGRNGQKDCPIISLLIGFVDWPDGAEPDPTIDLARRQMSSDFYITDAGGQDQTWRLFDLAATCGIETEGRPLGEVLPELIGQPVLVAITHYINKNTGETAAQVNRIVGLPA